MRKDARGAFEENGIWTFYSPERLSPHSPQATPAGFVSSSSAAPDPGTRALGTVADV